MRSAIHPTHLLAISLLLAGAGSAVAQRPEQPEEKLPAILKAKPLPADPKDDELRKLLKARYNEAVAELKAFYEHKTLPGVKRIYSLDSVYGRWQRLVQAGLELCDKPAEKVALLTQYLEITKEEEKDMQAQYDAGRTRIGDLHRVRYERLDAEIQLLRAKREADKAKDK